MNNITKFLSNHPTCTLQVAVAREGFAATIVSEYGSRMREEFAATPDAAIAQLDARVAILVKE